MECINVDMHFKQSLSSAFWNESSQQNNMLNTQNLLGIISKSMSQGKMGWISGIPIKTECGWDLQVICSWHHADLWYFLSMLF